MNSKIDQTMMRQIEIMEQDLNEFHGFRHLWAKRIANGETCGLSVNTLEAEQMARLESALGNAYSIAQILGIEWTKCEISREESHRRLKALLK